MKQVPASEYVCECCWKRFSLPYECEEHERKCFARKERIRNCKNCSGKGYITKIGGGEYVGTGYFGMEYYSKRYSYKEPCPRCNYKEEF